MGIRAARELKDEKINCNLTLVFSKPQAIACAEAGVKRVSPSVGPILDYYKAKTGKEYSAEEDPGVIYAKFVYNYYKKYGYKTEIMGASLGKTSQITELAGCDYLTISPSILETLMNSKDKVETKLSLETAQKEDIKMESYVDNEPRFRNDHNDDAMADSELNDGIRKFKQDAQSLKDLLREKLNNP